MADPVTLLKTLVAIPSVNPMGRALSGDEYLEGRLTEWLVAFLKTHDLPCEVVRIEPGRANVLTRIDIPGATKTLLFDAHQDTVPVDGMTIPPFEPAERDGRIYGRGSCDVKGGLAAMLSAGLDGIERNLSLPEPVEENLYHFTDEDLKRRNIPTLPATLGEAIEETERNETIRAALGDHVFERLLEAQRTEWSEFRRHVSTWERDRYLEVY